MWFTKDDDGYRAWFSVEDKNGLLRTGGVAGNFTVTVVEPGDTASSTPTVSESSTKPGLYTFLVPSSFFATHGVGGYGVVVEATFSSPPKIDAVFAEVLRVFAEDFDSLGTAISAISGSFLVDTTIASAVDAQNFQITIAGLTAGFYNDHFIQVSNGTRFAVALIETIDGSGNIVTNLPLPFTPSPGNPAQILSQLNVDGGSAG